MRNKKIALYGARAVGNMAYEYFSVDNQITAWVDRDYMECSEMPHTIEPVQVLGTVEYDYVVICVLKETTSRQIRENLVKNYAVPNNCIMDYLEDIWVPGLKSRYRSLLSVCRECLHMTDHDILAAKQENRIKVRVYFPERGHAWNVLKSVCLAFEEDVRFDLMVILNGWQESEKYRIVQNDVGKIMYAAEYDLVEDKPDIVIVNLYAACNKKELEIIAENAKYVCEIPIGLLRTGRTIEEHVRELIYNLDAGKMACCFLDKLLYQEISSAGLHDSRLVPLGSPKFDEIYNVFHMSKEVKYPTGWEKLEGRTVILWTTDHYIRDCNVTADLYLESMIRYFSSREDIALIFRPHPHLFHELVENKVWTEVELREFKALFDTSRNIVLDIHSDYSAAYYAADGIIADINCGIIISALPLGKPLGVLTRSDVPAVPLYPQVIDRLYWMRNEEELAAFIDMVVSGNDPRAKERDQAAEDFIFHFDGQNGKRIKGYITHDYEQRYGGI